MHCDPIFAGESSPSVYGDCGIGHGADLAPGATVDLAWDRRVYQSYSVPPECSGHPDGNSCWLGLAVAASTTQTGEITICANGGSSPQDGYCTNPETVPVSFDTSGDEATIEVM